MARSAFAAGTWQGPQTTHSATIGTWAAGDTLLACSIGISATATVTSWSMTGESAPTNEGDIERASSNSSIQWAILSNVTGTGSKTVTATWSTGVTGICFIWRLTGRDTAGAYDTQVGVSGTGTPSASNSITAAPGSDVFSVISHGGFGAGTPSSGTEETIPDFNNYEGAAYLENQSGAVDITWSWSGGGAYVVSAIAVKAAASSTIAQEGFRWGNDDGAENAHTWAAAADVNITAPAGGQRLLNFVIDVTGSPGAKVFKLQYRKVGDPTWVDMPVQ